MMETVKIRYQGTVFEVGEVTFQLADDPTKLARFVLADIIDNPEPIIEPEPEPEPEIADEQEIVEPEEPEIVEPGEPEECEECMIPEIEEQDTTEEQEPPAEEYVCPVCGKVYSSEGWFNRHMNTHWGGTEDV